MNEKKHKSKSGVILIFIAICMAITGCIFLAVSHPVSKAFLESMVNKGKDSIIQLAKGKFIEEEIPPESKDKTVPYDLEPPTFIAAVSNGYLTIEGEDGKSGLSHFLVNGFKFTPTEQGTLSIRLQQFDAGYRSFAIQAVDNLGNTSEEYMALNPYFSEDTSDTNENPAKQLPASASATIPHEARGEVIDHMIVELQSTNTRSAFASPMNVTNEPETSIPIQIVPSNETSSTDSTDENEDDTNTISIPERDSSSSFYSESEKRSREFYTVQTKNGKTFYLVIDKDGRTETAYFLTEISENDLLNATDEVSDTLPKNSAALSSDGIVDKGLPADGEEENVAEDTEGTEDNPLDEGNLEEEVEKEKGGSTGIIIVIVIAIVIGGYYLKVKRKKDGDFDDDDEEDNYKNEEASADEDEEDEPETEEQRFWRQYEETKEENLEPANSNAKEHQDFYDQYEKDKVREEIVKAHSLQGVIEREQQAAMEAKKQEETIEPEENEEE